ALKLKYIILVLTVASLGYVYPLYKTLNWEFMPMLNEQTFMYMPVTPYGIGVDLTKEITQKTDKILASFPEVKTVFGKGGRATTATDPAPLGMIETIITFKDEKEWREGMTYKKLMSEMEDALQIPGLINSWTYPIRGRIDMLLSGVRTPLGIKLYSKDVDDLEKYATQIEHKLRGSDLTQSVFADKASAGYYLDIDIDESSLARYNMSKKVLLEYVSSAIGGMQIGTMYKGVERYPITIRLEQNQRQSIEDIKSLHIKTSLGPIPLSNFAKISFRESSSVIKSEMALPVTYVYITPKDGVSPTAYKEAAAKLLSDVSLPDGTYIEWEGQSEYLESAMNKIVWIVPIVLLVILVLIYMALRELVTTIMIFLTLPFAFLGGLFYINYLNFSMSVAVVVGFLALLGIAAQTAIIMIIYLQDSVSEFKEKYADEFNEQHLRSAIYQGAVKRVRPKLMTLFATIAGLLPIMLSEGVGSEVMQRIAAPMMGGVVSSAVLSLLVIPVLYEMYIKRKMINSHNETD
ncbi:MAG: efflux RND transporter permease subunit, partial [Sulfurimonas sp.]|nr:efflux RND transporter permease subunit [Sulfurimonas sp.]